MAESLVNSRLAACVSHAPCLTSTYAWEGRVETASEVLLLIKTQTVLVGAVKTWIAEHHPYEVPEILVFNASDGLDSYLSWVKAQTDFPRSA